MALRTHEVPWLRISAARASALGDIRAAAYGETIWLGAGAAARRDWPRYVDALGVALTRGADIRWEGR